MGGQVRYACEWTPVGIGVAAQRNIRALIAHPDVGTGAAPSADAISLAWEPLFAAPHGRLCTTDSSPAAAWLRALRRPRADGEVLIQHSIPGAWKEVTEAVRPAHRIGYAVWELDDIPKIWLSEMSYADEFWVPTEWNRDAFERAFRRPVHVVPHVVTEVDPVPPPMDLPDDVAVVSTISAWDWRKRPDRAIEAFCHAFTSRDPVVLALKTTPWHVGWPGGVFDVPELIHRITERFPDPPTIHYSTAVWSDEQMAGLAARSICTLSLTASEGWGLGTFDAAAMGVPAIITGYGGQTEYLGADYPGLLPYRRVPTTHEYRSLFEFGTEWAHADMDAAVDLLRAMVDGSATALIERSADLAVEMRQRYSPAVVAEEMVRNLHGAFGRTAEPERPADASSVGSPAVGSPSTGRPARTATTGTALQDSSSTRPAPKVVVLTPIKNAAHHAVGFVDRILSLDHPPELLRVAVLVSDSVDDTAGAFRSEFERLGAAGIESSVHTCDFGFELPVDRPRWAVELQLQRRIVLAKSRNHLLSRGLGDADWALWIDVDVVEFPSDVIGRLLAVGGDVVQPHCLAVDGSTFDLNAWTDRGRYHLDDYAGHEVVELHAVGGTMLLVRADRHRDGLVWPAYLHGAGNDRIRIDPLSLGREEIGEVETEGLGILADDMGIACWGLPDLHIRHE